MHLVYCDLSWYDLETGKETGRVSIPNHKSITPYEIRKLLGEPVANCVHTVTPENIDNIREHWLPNQKFEFDKFGYEVEYSMATVISGKKGLQKIYF